MNLPALYQLMGAYLHQDFDLFGKTKMDAVDAYLRDEPDSAPALVEEIEFVLVTTPDEAGLKHTLDELGCQVLPPEEAGTYRRFLELIAERARGIA